MRLCLLQQAPPIAPIARHYLPVSSLECLEVRNACRLSTCCKVVLVAVSLPARRALILNHKSLENPMETLGMASILPKIKTIMGFRRAVLELLVNIQKIRQKSGVFKLTIFPIVVQVYLPISDTIYNEKILFFSSKSIISANRVNIVGERTHNAK